MINDVGYNLQIVPLVTLVNVLCSVYEFWTPCSTYNSFLLHCSVEYEVMDHVQGHISNKTQDGWSTSEGDIVVI